MDQKQQKKLVKVYDGLNWIYIPCKGKDASINGAGWNKIDKSIKPKKDQNVGFITGRTSNITVLDIDTSDDGLDVWKKIEPKLNLEKTPCVKTGGGGFHYYFEYEPDLGTVSTKCIHSINDDNKIQKIGIDIRNDSGFIVAPPSVHSSGQSYDWIVPPTEKLAKIPEVLTKLLKQQLYLKPSDNDYDIVELPKKQPKEKKVKEKKEKKTKTKSNEQEIDYERIVMGLDSKRADDRDDWLKIIFCLRNIANEKKIDLSELAIKFSQQSDKFVDEDDVLQHYNSENNTNNELTINTLLHYLQQDNTDLYDELYPTQSLKRTSILDDYKYTPKKATNRNFGYSDFREFARGRIPLTVDNVMDYFKDSFAVIADIGSTKYFAKDYDSEHNTIRYNQIAGNPFCGELSIYRPIGADKYIRFSEAFNLYATLHSYKHLAFKPYLKTNPVPADTFNLFSGFKYTYEEIKYESPPPELSNVLYHIKEIIASGDPAIAEYVLNWITHLFQKPHDKIGIAILLHSEAEGTGKNSFTDFLMNILGSSLTFQTERIEDLTGRFNSATQGKVLGICNEVANFAGFKVADMLKAKITEKTQRIEPKGKESFQMDDYMRYIFTSNSPFALRLSRFCRRYLTITISSAKAGDTEYFKKLHKDLADHDIQKLFFNYMANRDIENWNYRKIPSTALKRDLVLEGCPSSIRYLVAVGNGERNNTLESESDADRIKVSSICFYTDYKDWATYTGEKVEMKKTFGRNLDDLKISKGKISLGSMRVNGYDFTKQELEIAIKTYLRDDTFSFQQYVEIVDDDE
jgi:hypothetical protein